MKKWWCARARGRMPTLAALAAAAAWACAPAGDDAADRGPAEAEGAGAAPVVEAAVGPLPAELLGHPLGESQTGERAAETLGRMHGQGVAPTESYIGHYGPEESRIVLYVSRFATPAEAQAQLDAMSTRIGSGSSGYSGRVRHLVGDVEVHGVQGHGQAHWFYARDVNVVWVAAPGASARASLAELLGVAVTEIPTSEGASTGTGGGEATPVDLPEPEDAATGS